MAKEKQSKEKAKAKARPQSKPKKKPAAPVKRTPVARKPLLTEENRRVVRIVLGVLCGILTIYTLVALLSYVFTWTSDQSLAFDSRMFTTEVTAENAGGKIGFIWADFLISKLFGFGAFALPIFLGALTVYCFRIRKVNLLRVFLLCRSAR